MLNAVRRPPTPDRRRRLVCSAVAVALLIAALQIRAFVVSREGLECTDFDGIAWDGTVSPPRLERDIATPTLVLRPAERRERYSTECRGWLFVERAASYEFVLGSDDGSALFIDDKPVVDNYGQHGLQYRFAEVEVPPGARPITIRYSQAGGGYAFALLQAQDRAPLAQLSPWAVSRRPLTRPEFLFRPWARTLQALLVTTAVGLLLWTWRRAVKAVGRIATNVLQRTHGAALATPQRPLLILLIAAAGARLGVMLGSNGILYPDSYGYYLTALDILRGDWMNHEIFRTPLFPAFLAAFLIGGETETAGSAMIAAQHAFGVGATLAVYDLGRRVFSQAVGFYGALLWTLSPIQLYYENTVSTESTFTVVVIVLVWLGARVLGRWPGVWLLLTIGVLSSVATLIRPVGKGLGLLFAAIIGWWAPQRRLPQALLVFLCSVAVTVPWMWANSQTYGFFGISRGQGFGLFMRAYDIDHLPLPDDTAYPTVREAFDRLRHRRDWLHYPVRDELNYHLGHSSLTADQAMEGFALESIRSHPVSFATGVAYDWVRLMVMPNRSVDICRGSNGPYLCASRNLEHSERAFSNRPPSDNRRLREIIATYFTWGYWIVPLLTPLAFCGLWSALLGTRSVNTRQGAVLLGAVIFYMTALAVTFNTVEDRYRLPIDAFTLLLAVAGAFALVEALRFRRSRFRPLAVPGSWTGGQLGPKVRIPA